MAETEELCPSCGNWAHLDNLYGWCQECIVESDPNHRICNNCGKSFKDRFGTTVCDHCKLEKFLTNNADRMEELMSKGLSYSNSIIQVRKELRPSCVICNEPIRGAPNKDVMFCRKEARAKKIYLKHMARQKRRNYRNREEALRLTLEELNGDDSS